MTVPQSGSPPYEMHRFISNRQYLYRVHDEEVERPLFLEHKP